MKKTLSLAISAALLGFSASAQAVSLYDFDEANSSYEDAYVSGNLDVSSGGKDSDGNTLDQTSHKLSADLEYERVIGTPRRDIELNASLAGESQRSGAKGADTVNSYRGDASGSVNTYFTNNLKGAYWYGDAAASKKDGLDKRNANGDIIETLGDEVRFKVGAGVGYGRVVNVTPMARAIRIVDELRAQGKIKSAVPKTVYKEVARVIDSEDAYRAKHGVRDYAKYWTSDMEKVLKAAGVVSDLGAVGILSINDVLVNERISTRKYGWRVQAGVSQVIQDYDGEKSQQAMDIQGEYHRPLSNQTQFSNVTTLSKIVDEDGHDLSNKMSLTHEISDRIDWENSWESARSKDKDGETDYSNRVASTFIYSLGNRLDYTVKATAAKSKGDEEVDKDLTMGIKYRLK